MAKEESCQTIFGPKIDGLENIVKKGWKIERAIEDVSLREENYEQDKSKNYEFDEII